MYGFLYMYVKEMRTFVISDRLCDMSLLEKYIVLN